MSLFTFFNKSVTFNWLGFNRVLTKNGFAKKINLNFFKSNNEIFNVIKHNISKNKNFYIFFLQKKKWFFTLLKDIKHAKGKRLIFGLPLNGQRTHTNAKTIRKLSSKK